MDKYARPLKGNEEVLLPPTLKENGEKWFDENNISHAHIARHIFKESCRSVWIGNVSGNKWRRFSPLFIRLCIKLRDKLKNDLYSFMAEAFK